MKKPNGLPWWAWIPFLPVLLALLLIWRLRQRTSRARVVNVHRDSIPLPADSPHHIALHEVAPDDLVVIKGIGVKSAAVLKAAGIGSFASLAQTSPERLREILLAAGLRLPDPSTWPAQAAALLHQP